MELFERLLKLVELLEDNSQAQFAKRLNMVQQTFNNYLNFSGQQKIRKTLLDKILVAYPILSRDWLFFGEGPMLKADVPSTPLLKASAQPDSEERIRELKYTIELQRKLLDSYESGFTGNSHARGVDSAVLVSHQGNEQNIQEGG